MSSIPNEYWYRLASLTYDAVLPALVSVIHNDDEDKSYTGLPRNHVDLYNVLSTTHKKKLDTLKTKKVIDQVQYNTLLPSSGETDSSDFDVSMAYLVIRNLLGLKTRIGWNIETLRRMNPQEISIAPFVMRGKEVRNFLSHNKPDSITQQVFDDQWKEGEDVINGLNYTGCDLPASKKAPLDSITIQKLDTRIRSSEVLIQAVEKRVLTVERSSSDLQREISGLRQSFPDLLQNLEEGTEHALNDVRRDMSTLQEEVPRVEIPCVNEKISALEKDLGKIKVDSLSMILGIVQSKSKHILDFEESVNSVNQKIRKIEDGVNHLKMRDLNLSQYQLGRIIIRIGNKFAPSKKISKISKETTQEIDNDLKAAQESALRVLSSGIGYIEKIQCIKIVLITDCFLVLNTLSCPYDIKADEIQLFSERLSNAQDLCKSTLSIANNIAQVMNYLLNKVLIGGTTGTVLQRFRRRMGIGIGKSMLAREVIMMNICIRFFFQHYEEKLNGAKSLRNMNRIENMFKNGSVSSPRTRIASSETLGKERNCSTICSSTEIVSATLASNESIQLDEDVIYIGAALSVIKKDAELARIIENYVKSQNEPYDHYELVEKYLREAPGVQRAVKKKKAKALKVVMRKEGKCKPLKTFTKMAVMSSMENCGSFFSILSDGSTDGTIISMNDC